MAPSLGTFLRHNRRYVVGVLVIVVALLLITSFSTFEGGRSGATQHSGWRIGDDPILVKQLLGVQRALRVQAVFGAPVEPSELQLVEHLARDLEAKQLGIMATDIAVQNFYTDPIFQLQRLRVEADVKRRQPFATSADLNAAWNQWLNERLKQQGLKDEDLDNFARALLKERELTRFVLATTKLTPLAMQQKEESLLQMFTVDIVNVASSTFANSVTITAEEIKELYEKTKPSHMTPRRVKVLYAKVAAEKFTDQVSVTDEQIKRYYDLNDKEFADEKGVPKKLEEVQEQIRQKLLLQAAAQPAHKKAADIAERLYKIAEQLYNTPRTAALKESDLRDYYAANAPTFVDAHGASLTINAILSDATLAAALRHRVAMTMAFNDCLKEFDPALGLQLQQTEYFDRNGTDDALQFGRQFRDEAFALNSDRPVGNAIRDGNDSYVIAFLDALPPAQKPLEAVAPLLRETLASRKQIAEALNAAEALIKQLRQKMGQGMSFTEAAETLSLKPRAIKPFNFLAPEQTLTADEMALLDPLGDAIESVGEGELTPAVRTAGGAVFGYVRNRQPGDPKMFEKQLAHKRIEEREAFAQKMLNEWRRVRIFSKIRAPLRDASR